MHSSKINRVELRVLHTKISFLYVIISERQTFIFIHDDKHYIIGFYSSLIN